MRAANKNQGASVAERKSKNNGKSESRAGPLRAAQYLRMSTEHQQYSTENQADAIAQYADMDGMAGPTQQDAIAFHRRGNLGPTLPLGVVAEGAAHDQHVLGIADLGQQTAEMLGLDHADEFPAIERVRPAAVDGPRQADISDSPMHDALEGMGARDESLAGALGHICPRV